ncbi:MAG: hypothetical protein BWY59_00513 [Verrucomicrobia bacterium ADurb.Bin345]|nr:MAG: hypothetical protein BWY59_00513 [Verrucomicrobia bacterium ADurb.Bin345]
MVASAGLSDGLVLYYTFNRDFGGVVADASGQGVGGLVLGAVHVPDGRCGAAYGFDGADDYIQVSRNPTTSRNYTVSLWFTLASTNHMLEKVLFSYNRRYLVETAFRNDRWCFITYALSSTLNSSYGAVLTCSDEIALPENVWQHVVLVVSDGTPPTARFYLNGQDIGGGEGLDVNAGSLGMFVGALLNDPANPPLANWQGMIDEVRVYDRVLSPAEIEELAGGCPAPVPPEGGPFVATIGFSTDPAGEQDVTEFYPGETLHVRVTDVDMEGCVAPMIRVVLRQPRAVVRAFFLARNADGSFTGSYALSGFREGNIQVDILAMCPRNPFGKSILMRRGVIHMNAD